MYQDYIAKILNKFKNPTLKMISEVCSSTIENLKTQQSVDRTNGVMLKKNHLLGKCLNESLATDSNFNGHYDCWYECTKCKI